MQTHTRTEVRGTRVKGLIHVCIVDDHVVIRDGLAMLIDQEPDMHVVGRFDSVREGDALLAFASETVDLLFLEMSFIRGKVPNLLGRLREASFQGRVVVLAETLSPQEAFYLACQGVAGMLSTRSSPQLFLKCIRKVAAGELWYDQEYLQAFLERANTLAEKSKTFQLKDREREVLRHVVQGKANKEIAAELGIPESSVKGILQRLFRRAGVRTRSQLVSFAISLYGGQL